MDWHGSLRLSVHAAGPKPHVTDHRQLFDFMPSSKSLSGALPGELSPNHQRD
jgi:hypothetical protein